MDCDRFVETVRTRLGRSDEATAHGVTQAVAATLAERLPPAERRLVRRVFPSDLDAELDADGPAASFDYETFLDRVAERSESSETLGSGAAARRTVGDGGVAARRDAARKVDRERAPWTRAVDDESGFAWTTPDSDRIAYRAMVVLEVAADAGSADDLARVAAALPTAYDDLFTLVESVDAST